MRVTFPCCGSLAIALVAITACGSSTSPAPPRGPAGNLHGSAGALLPEESDADRCRRHDNSPAGAPFDYTPPRLEGFRIDKPESCERNSAYIRVERTRGTRVFGTGRGTSGGFSEGCMTAPANATDCPVINIVVPGKAVVDELRRRGVNAGGPGLGPCGDLNGDYDAWNFSIKVTSWEQAEPAVRLVAAALERYDIAGTIGVGVEAVHCAVLL